VSTQQILLGTALTLVLAVGSQILAGRLRIPALIVLLPVGFTAGATTDIVDPERLWGLAFQPLVSLAVAVILYDAALGLDLRRLRGHTRRTVVRLIAVGVPLTWVSATLLALWLLGMSPEAALMIGAILVVSGPTVVGPLLAFVGPTDRLRRILSWEGSLVDAVGGILGAVVFHAITSSTRRTVPAGVVQFVTSIGVGVLVGIAGIGALWFVLRVLRVGEVLGTLAQLAVVIAVAAICEVVREDSGLIAAIIVGLAVANLPGFDISARRPFFETLVQLILGLLFISISATVAPDSLLHLVVPTLGMVAVLVLITRPLVALLSTWRTELSSGERRFVGWMAPRGIVAAATASTFSTQLVNLGLAGATKILPGTFLVIVMTVTLYGLTAAPVAHRLGVVRTTRARPLLIGGEPWVIELGQVLRTVGLDILMWAGPASQRDAIRASGIELAPDELIIDAADPAARLEGVTSVLLLTGEDDFNAVAAVMLRGYVDGQVYRLAPPAHSHGVVSSRTGGSLLFSHALTRDVLTERYRDGSRIVVRPADHDTTGYALLFRIRADGSLLPVTRDGSPPEAPGDTLVLLGV